MDFMKVPTTWLTPGIDVFKCSSINIIQVDLQKGFLLSGKISKVKLESLVTIMYV